MNKKILIVFLFVTLPMFAADSQWVLKQSTLTYHVSHKLHESEGVSHAARGKGVCHDGQCNFLIAVAVKSFDSGDSNRDLHMIQVTRGAQFPIISVRLHLAETSLASPTLDCALEVQFAGNTAHYPHVQFQQTIEGTTHHITGTVPSTLT